MMKKRWSFMEEEAFAIGFNEGYAEGREDEKSRLHEIIKKKFVPLMDSVKDQNRLMDYRKGILKTLKGMK
jgi:flagellar biosynthesis/type III secretory pathway protein FliH